MKGILCPLDTERYSKWVAFNSGNRTVEDEILISGGGKGEPMQSDQFLRNCDNCGKQIALGDEAWQIQRIITVSDPKTSTESILTFCSRQCLKNYVAKAI
jgi:hypothetical protein